MFYNSGDAGFGGFLNGVSTKGFRLSDDERSRHDHDGLRQGLPRLRIA